MKAKLHRAAMRAAEPERNGYPIKPPDIPPGVVPPGRTAPVLAMDYSPFLSGATYAPDFGFPGFQYLSMLATRAEYRQFATALSTEIVREWIEFTSTGDSGTDAEEIRALESAFKEFGIRHVIEQAVQHDCFFGRAQIFLDLEGHDRALPLVLHEKTVKPGSLRRIVNVEPIWTTPAAYNALDPAAPDFYKPSAWFMLGQEVHATRLLTIVTRPLPDMLKPAFNFAGMSLSQLAEPYVDNWLRTRQSVADLINNFSITALATDMSQTLAGDDDGSDLFARAQLFTATRSNRGLMLLDKEHEELIQLNVSLAGLHELQAQAQEHLCSVSRLPAIILTGISPSGLNASSDGEIRVFYDWIAAQQESHWRKPLEIILRLMQLHLFGRINENINFAFRPLYQLTPKEEAEMQYVRAQTAALYIDRGVISPDEERERLATGEDTGYLGLDLAPDYSDDLEGEPLEGEPLESAEDRSVSAAQHRAMAAAAAGHSTLGIPKSVGEEFLKADKGAHFKR